MSTKLIALVDWNWMGHHPTHFTQFAVAIAQAGVRVAPFCSDPEDFQKRLVSVAPDREVAEQILEPQKVEGPKSSNFRPARWRGIYEARKFYGMLGKQLRAWERHYGRKIDLVFFACIYDWQFLHFRVAEKLFGFHWSGVYLHARSFRMPDSPMPYTNIRPCPEAIFSSPLIRSAVVRDEHAVRPMMSITGGKPIIVFPETAHVQLPPEGDSRWGLVGKVRQLAAGRPIVSLVGYLQQTKGVEEFTHMANSRSLKSVLFFLAGQPSFEGFGPEVKTRLEQVWEQAPNIWAHLQKLPELTLNTIIASSNVVFAAYRNFPNISNILTKTAYFKRPVIVSDGYLMAEQVRRFNLGEVVPEGDLDSMMQTLGRMLAPGYEEGLRMRARWADFSNLHSLDQLNVAMKSLLEVSLR